MEAIFKMNSNELDEKFFNEIKNLFKGERISIIVTTEPDETEYLTSNASNEKFLLENIAEEPTIQFTPSEFEKHVKDLQSK